MKTYKLDIKSISNTQYIEEKQIQYSHAMRTMYKSFNKLDDSEYIKFIKNKFSLNDIEYRSIRSQFETKFAQIKTNKSNLENEIILLEEKIKELRKIEKRTSEQTKDLFKTKRKLDNKTSSLSNDIVFGTRSVLSYYTHLCNKIRSFDVNSEDYNKTLKTLNDKLFEYKQNRINNIYLLGESNQHGNRFFDFDIVNKTIIYKPKKSIKIQIKFENYKCHKEELLKIQELIEKKLISVTVNLNTKQIQISVDDTIFNNYKLDIKSRTEEVDKIKELHLEKDIEKQTIVNTYRKYYEELENRKLNDKLSKRYMGVDLNPDHIGISILDKNNDGSFKIIHVRDFNLSQLNIKLPKEATKEERKKQNGKRKLAISLVWKEIFRIFTYYNCSRLVLEELNLKTKDLHVREANRKINNLWHRTLTNQLIEKYCNKLGIIVLNVIPVYSSLIGNLYYKYNDPVNASIEICRRGLFMYEKGKLYPSIDTGTISNTMSRINTVDLWDVSILKDCDTWKKVYKTIKESGLRYRAKLCEVSHIRVCKLSHASVENISFQIIT